MVTKRTRLLSIITTALMLVSMFACFVIPASAESATLAELKAKYDILDPANFEGLEGTPIEDMRAYIATKIDEYNAAEGNAAVQEAYEQLATEQDAALTNSENGTLYGKVKSDAEIRYAIKGYYEALGYTTGATVYLISEVEDWTAISADDKSFSGVTLKVTNNIDFSQAGTLAPLVPTAQFAGTLDGQGYKLIGLTVARTGETAGSIVSTSGACVIQNLGLEGGSLTHTVSGDGNKGAGSFIGYTGSGASKIFNCWSTMSVVTAGTGDSVGGAGGFVGFAYSGSFTIDNCFFAGSVTNTNGPACDFVGYGANTSKVNNSIGAGTLTTDAADGTAMVGHHKNFLEQYANRDAVLTNSYVVGHTAIRYRGGTPTANPSNEAVAVYNNEGWNDATLEKYHTAATLEEAAWKVNSNFSTVNQSAQTYFFDVDAEGNLCFTTDADATLKKVTITGDAEKEVFLHAGAEISLIDDLGLRAQIASATITESYEDALSATYVLTVPNADVEIVVTYETEALLSDAKATLYEMLSLFEGVDFANLTDEYGDLEYWYEEAVLAYEGKDYEGNLIEDDLELLAAIESVIDWRGDFEVTLADGFIPVYSEYDAYAPFNTANVWNITTAEDWLYAVDRGTAADLLTAEFHLTKDIDFGADCEAFAPLGYGGVFTGSIDGHGYTFSNINIYNPTNEDRGTALISQVNGVVIKNLGIASGQVVSTATSTYGGYAAAFVGQQAGALEVYNCWNAADVTSVSTKYAFAAGLISNCGNNALKIVGFYNLGDITANADGGTAAAVWASGTSHGLTIAAHVYNAGTLTGASARLWRSNVSAGYPARNFITNNEAYLTNNYYANNDSDLNAGRWDAGTVMAEDGGAYGHTLNQRATSVTDKSNASVPAVYWTIKDGISVFGTETNQTRKVTFAGAVLKTVYAVPGDTITLSDIAAGAEFAVSTAGYESAIAEGVLTVPAADITVTVTGDVVDEESYVAGKAALAAYIETYESLDTSILTNGDAINELITEAEAALAADEAGSTNETKRTIISLAGEAATTTPVLAEGKYVPYSKKDTIFGNVNAGGNYGIYDAADWAAFVAAGANAGLTIHLMKDVTLPADAPVLGNTAFSGTFDGGNNTLTVAHTATVASGNKYGIFGNGGTIKNLKIAGTVAYTIGSAASPVAANTFAAIVSGGGAAVETVTNDASLTVEGYGAGRMWIATMTGELGYAIGCTNNGAITFTGYSANLAVGGIIGRTNNSNGVQNCINNGTITLNETSTSNGNNTYVGGISGTTAGHNSTNVTNNGDIIVNSGRRVYVGGIQSVGTDTNENYLYGNIVNTGDIKVTLTVGGDVCVVGGIFGNMMWTVAEGATISNSGAINVDGANATTFRVSGIANTLSEKKTTDETAYLAKDFAATSVGNIWVGGKDLANDAQLVSLMVADLRNLTVTVSGTPTGTITICQHTEYTSEDDLVNVVTVNDCDACSYTWQTDYEGGEDAAYLIAKAELQAIVEKLEAFDADLFTNGADMTAALTAAKAVLAADAEESTADTQQAIIDEAAKDDVVPALKSDAKIPYSKKDTVYADYEANSTYGIYDEADWNAFVALADHTGLTFYVMNNITLTAAETAVVSHFKGTLDGQSYTISGINITTLTHTSRVGLFLENTGTIKNLKLDGTVNVTFGSADAPAGNVYTGMFGARNNGLVDNCVNYVDMTVVAYTGGGDNCFGGLTGYLGNITNSTNEGTLIFSVGCTNRSHIGAIGGRIRATASGNINNGALTVNILDTTNTGNYYIGGIGADCAGATLTGSVNNGDITVNGGFRVYVGGVISATSPLAALTATNTGDVTVTSTSYNAAQTIRIIKAAGINGGSAATPANTADTAYVNSGNIKVDAVLSAQTYAYGIAVDAASDTLFGTNTGTIWAGGFAATDDSHRAGDTFSGAASTNTTICAHGAGDTVHVAETTTHKFTCGTCSYFAVEDCDVTFTANDDLVYNEETKTVTATHTGACADCEEEYTEACEGTLSADETTITFECCDRADYVIAAPGCEHNGEVYYSHIDGTETHKVVCEDCDATINTYDCTKGDWEEGTLVYENGELTATHSTDCAVCSHTYTEDCEATLVDPADDCTKDSYYTFACDREDYTIADSGNAEHSYGEWTTEGATEGYQRKDCAHCDAYVEELLPLPTPVITITTNVGKAGQTGVAFTVTLTGAAVKGGTVTIALPAWAENVALTAGTNVTIVGLVANITGDIAAGSVLLTGTYDIDVLADETAAITATAANILDANGEAVTVEAASADAAIDVIVGDAKVDGSVNLIDAIAVLRGAAGLDSEVNVANGDINGVDGLDVDDAVLIVRWWLGDPTYQGPEMGV